MRVNDVILGVSVLDASVNRLDPPWCIDRN
jgi:hypothetical protein